MPPTKAASAGEDNQCPTLKLIMENGPLSGQANDFRPETRIQIGRAVSGNTLSIKDASISPKHLLIQVEPVAGRRRWTVTDQDSLNGTFLNGARLEPFEPAPLSDGDVIKIGEQTSLKVRFEVRAGEVEVSTSNVRRNARRCVRKQVEELGVIDEDSELGLGFRNSGLGLTNGKFVDSPTVEKNARGRATRGTKARELINGSKEETGSLGKKRLRKTRSSKDESSENLIIDLDGDEAQHDEEQGRNVGMRRTRNSMNTKNLNIEVDKNLKPSGMKIMERVGVRRTRSSRMEENMDDPFIDLSVIEGKRTRRGTRGRKNATAFASTSRVNEGAAEIGSRDLEKMTLREWFEFLEVYLPKQIVDATEEMISEMRRKAERLHEFVLQLKGDVATDEKIECSLVRN